MHAGQEGLPYKNDADASRIFDRSKLICRFTGTASDAKF